MAKMFSCVRGRYSVDQPVVFTHNARIISQSLWAALSREPFLKEVSMSTYTPKASEIVREWHVVDAEGMILGRLCTEVARVLRGKHKPTLHHTWTQAITSSSSTLTRLC